jgi:hypothetical protein
MSEEQKINPLLLHSVAWMQHDSGLRKTLPDGWRPCPCMRCGIPCVLSPSSLQWLEQGATPLCYDCAGPIMARQWLTGEAPKVKGTALALHFLKQR